MKKYEEIAKLKGEIKRIGSYYERKINNLDGTERAMKIKETSHLLEMEAFKKELLFLEKDKAIYFDQIKELKAKLKRVQNRKTPGPKPKPKIVKAAIPKKTLKSEVEIREKQVEELKEIIEEPITEGPIMEGPIINEDAIQKQQIEIITDHKEVVNGQLAELQAGKIQCSECGDFFTKGGAFIAHYKSHFKNGNGG